MTTEGAEPQSHREEKPDQEKMGLGGELTEGVIGAAIAVHKYFGPGFLEQTCHRAMEIELRHLGIRFRSEVPVILDYRGTPVGEGRIDLLVADKLIIELKSVTDTLKAYQRQVLAYLKATNLSLGLVINFAMPQLRDGLSRVALWQGSSLLCASVTQ